MRPAVVLLSGGLDSTTMLAMARRERYQCHALTVSYGQRHGAELKAAKNVAGVLGAASHKLVSVALDSFGGSALTSKSEVPKGRSESEMGADIPVTYVPARNTVLLALALSYAESLGARDIFIGVNSVDYSGYPDCRAEFIRSFEQTARLGTKAGVEGAEICIHAPLIHMTKQQIIRLGLDLGVDYSLTHSCYDPDPNGRACGRCDACQIRKRAFESIGMSDPALMHLAHG